MRDRNVFMWQSRKISHVFNTWTLKQVFWKMQTFFKKLKYSSLVESTKIENITFPYKTALSESNAKTNRMGSTMDLSQKMEFCQFCLFFNLFCFSLRTCHKELIWATQMSLFILFESVGVSFEGVFSCEYP